MFKTLHEMGESLKRLQFFVDVKVVQAHPAAIIREENVVMDDDVVDGGQNFRGEDGKRGTV